MKWLLCLHYFCTFTTSYALKCHISEKHQYNTNKDEKKAFQSNIPYKEFSLWNEDFTINYAKVISQSIIIYTDTITCNHLGKTSEHSIYILLSNISNWL